MNLKFGSQVMVLVPTNPNLRCLFYFCTVLKISYNRVCVVYVCGVCVCVCVCCV